jgi:hypothetical protein
VADENIALEVSTNPEVSALVALTYPGFHKRRYSTQVPVTTAPPFSRGPEELAPMFASIQGPTVQLLSQESAASSLALEKTRPIQFSCRGYCSLKLKSVREQDGSPVLQAGHPS